MELQRETLRQAGLPQKDIDQLEAAWNAYRAVATAPQRQIPHIVCTGIYNAGKSTLLNALAGKEFFPTGDIPTTKKVARAEFDGAVYIDTPGLNAQDADDLEARKAYESSDFVLFVSNIQNGGISEAESEWLKELSARHTADSLRQRLVYVLTHCGQTEEAEQIKARFQSDFKKAMGFELNTIFCVDSITYMKGVSENKRLLVEHSGISLLQASLDKLIAESGERMKQAREVELEAQKKGFSEQASRCRLILEEKQVEESRSVREKITAVQAAWTELEENLDEALPVREIKISGYLGSLPSCTLDVKERSEDSARRKAEDKLKTVYDKRERLVQEAIRNMMPSVKRYCFVGLDSAYASCCNRVAQALNIGLLALQKLELSIPAIAEIFVAPELPSGLLDEIKETLASDVVQYGGYYTLRKYVEMYTAPSCYPEYVSGLFGIQREVDMYHISDSWSVIREMEKDMESSWKSNIASANSTLNRYWKDFYEKLTKEVEKRKAIIKTAADTYTAALKLESGGGRLSVALTQLADLEKEASK